MHRNQTKTKGEVKVDVSKELNTWRRKIKKDKVDLKQLLEQQQEEVEKD